MKNSVIALVTVFVLGILIIAGCTNPAPAPPPTPTPTPAPAPAPAPAAKGPIELKFAHHVPEKANTNTKYLAAWAKQVEEATNNQVKITVYPGQTLVKAADAIQATEGGVCDIEWATLGYFPGQFVATQVMTLPTLNLPLAEKNSRILQELYEKFPDIQNEYKNVKLLQLNASDPFSLFTIKKPVTKLDELKGMKIRDTNGPYPQKLWEKLGASSVGIPMPGVYEAAEKGVIDGISMGWGGHLSFNLYEVFNYWTKNTANSPTLFALIMNLDKWNSLSPDIQNAIMSVSGVKGAMFGSSQAFGPGLYKAAQGKMKAGGFTIEEVELDASELAKFKKTAQGLWGDWVKEVTAKGIKGQEILDEAIRLIDLYK